VLRSGNKKAAAITLLLDALKGWLPVWWVATYGPDWGLGAGSVALVGLAAFLGHLFPVFFRFKGGKGVATAAGVLLAYDPWLGLLILLTWVGVAVVFRYSSLAAIVATLAAPFFYLFGDGMLWSSEGVIGVSMGVMSVLLLWRHADNIQRLLAGKETRIGAKKNG